MHRRRSSIMSKSPRWESPRRKITLPHAKTVDDILGQSNSTFPNGKPHSHRRDHFERAVHPHFPDLHLQRDPEARSEFSQTSSKHILPPTRKARAQAQPDPNLGQTGRPDNLLFQSTTPCCSSRSGYRLACRLSVYVLWEYSPGYGAICLCDEHERRRVQDCVYED